MHKLCSASHQEEVWVSRKASACSPPAKLRTMIPRKYIGHEVCSPHAKKSGYPGRLQHAASQPNLEQWSRDMLYSTPE